MITPAQLLDLLANSVADAQANELVEECSQLGMQEIPLCTPKIQSINPRPKGVITDQR